MQFDEPRPVMEGPPGPYTLIDGARYLYFGGTGYLALAGHPEVIEAACAATRTYGLHAATSRSGLGNSPPVLAAEERAAEFFGTESAYYFLSGYLSNHVLMGAIAGRFDAIFLDASSHYSVREAAKLAERPVYSFAHRDAGDLRAQLRAKLGAGERPAVMSDGVFPATGVVAPLDEYASVLREYPGASLVVDDAHGVGVLGEHGRGTAEHWGLWDQQINSVVDKASMGIYVGGTLSKAIGGYGGIVAGTAAFVTSARGSSRYYAGTTPVPAPVAGATARAIEIAMREPERRQRLRTNAAQLRTGLRGLGLAVAEAPTPVVGLCIGSATNMQRIHEGLKAEGIMVPRFGAYSDTGPEGLLRVAVCSEHTREMIDRLVAALGRLL